MKYFIWGIGERLNKNINRLNLEDVIGFVDKKAGQGLTDYLGKPLIVPEHILDYEFDYIVISSNKYFDEIAGYCIMEFEIGCEKIVRLDYVLGQTDTDFIHTDMQLKYRDLVELTEGRKKASIVRSWMRKDILDEWPVGEYVNHSGYLFSVSLQSRSIRIYQVTHKLFQQIQNANYLTIGVGEEKLPYSMDNTGDHIAEYNKKINECTALYWIWKHEKAEYIGLNHYRRVFESEFNRGWPLQDVEALLLLQKYDVIAAEAVVFQNDTVMTMLSREICEEALEQSRKILFDIFECKPEEEQDAFHRIINGSIIFPCNMFIMSRDKVDQYCSWIFPILFELIDKVEIKEEWNTYSKRVIGFWAERMFTVWLYLGGYRVKELPILPIGDCHPYGKE